MGNQFYAASAWAGSSDWKALLFGSLDPANFITVDKPPVSQWVMGLSGQLFGFSSASMLVPEALMAVGSVALLYAAVRRISGPQAALLAGAVLALTPVAALMFRFNNPDAAMVLLMTAAGYRTVRALQGCGARWLMLAGVALGFAFLAKMLEGLMAVPAIAVVYLVAAAGTDATAPAAPGWLAGGVSGFRRMVRGAHSCVAGLVAALSRRVHRQQLHESGVGLQRIRSGTRSQPHGRWRGHGSRGRRAAERGRTRRSYGRIRQPVPRPAAPVHRRVRLRNRLAAAGRPARHGAGTDLAARYATDRHGPGRSHPVRRLAADRRRCPQLHEEHGPPVLLPVAGTGDGGDVRDRRRRDVASAR